MYNKVLCEQLIHQYNQYHALNLRTAETDLAIVRQLAYCRSITQIAMETPCSEATVYRAIQRVRSFLAK